MRTCWRTPMFKARCASPSLPLPADRLTRRSVRPLRRFWVPFVWYRSGIIPTSQQNPQRGTAAVDLGGACRGAARGQDKRSAVENPNRYYADPIPRRPIDAVKSCRTTSAKPILRRPAFNSSQDATAGTKGSSSSLDRCGRSFWLLPRGKCPAPRSQRKNGIGQQFGHKNLGA